MHPMSRNCPPLAHGGKGQEHAYKPQLCCNFVGLTVTVVPYNYLNLARQSKARDETRTVMWWVLLCLAAVLPQVTGEVLSAWPPLGDKSTNRVGEAEYFALSLVQFIKM